MGVLHLLTLVPFDEETVIKLIRKTRAPHCGRGLSLLLDNRGNIDLRNRASLQHRH